jgi:membrane peptidoglycan carboxypeptidase
LATQGVRQPGSTYKAITLAAAIEAGYSPYDSVDGSSPCTIRAKGYAPWDTSNAEPYSGSVTDLRSATAGSVNCAFAHLIAAVGAEKVSDMAKRMGVTTPVPAYLSITLGTAEASPLDMTTVFATLAADGVRHRPVFVRRVETSSGDVLFEEDTKGERVMDAQVARTVTSMLAGTITGGTGTRANIGRPQAGKTGTSEKNGDAWFCGYTPDASSCVWMGAPVGRVSMTRVGQFSPVYGGTYPAIIWKAFMLPWLEAVPENAFGAPDRSKWPAGKFIASSGRGTEAPPEESTTTSSSEPTSSTSSSSSTTTTVPASTTTTTDSSTTTTEPPGSTTTSTTNAP